MYKSKRSLKVYVIFHLIMSVLEAIFTSNRVRINIQKCPYCNLDMSVFDFNRVRIASLIMSVLEFDYF